MNLGLTTIALATIAVGTLSSSEAMSTIAGPGFLLLFGAALRGLGALLRRRSLDAPQESTSAAR